jgi:hypothetical protein
LDDPGMRVTGCDDRNSGVEIKKAVAVHILNNRPFASLDDEWIAAGVRRGKNGPIARDNGTRFGPRQL